MIRREILQNGEQVKVTFVLPHDPDQGRIYVAGDFNDWNPTSHLLVKRSNDTRSVSVLLTPNQRYAFRYCTEDGRWFNDAAPDAYEPGPYGSDNCIVAT